MRIAHRSILTVAEVHFIAYKNRIKFVALLQIPPNIANIADRGFTFVVITAR